MTAALFLGGIGLGAVGTLAGVALPARARVPAAAVLTVGACAAVFAAAAVVLTSGKPITAASARILPFTGVTLSLDRLGAVFAATTAVVAAAVSCYAVGYAAHGGRSRTGTAVLSLFVTSMLLVPAAASVATFLATWELMALSSLVLLLTGHQRPAARDAALWYAVLTQAGAAAVLLALVLMSAHAGGQDFAVIRAQAGGVSPALRSVAFLLALGGFASKAGAVPLHVWLPRAHPEVPGPVSALMSGAMVNLGIYGIVRTGDDLLGGGQLWWWLVVAGLGVASALYGALHAAASPDLKRLLGYSTVDNMGLVLIGVGASGALAVTGHRVLGALALTAALFQMVSHAAFKGCLFLGAGAVQQAAGTRDLDRLGGLARRMPVTAVTFGVAALSVCALPPFSGFASEWLLLQGFLHGFSGHSAPVAAALLAGVAALALAGGLTAAAFVKAFGIGFLGQPRTREAAAATERDPLMLAGMAVLAVPCVVLGVAPGIVVARLAQVAASVLGGVTPGPLRAGTGLAIAGTADVIRPALLALALLAALLLAAAVVRFRSRARGAQAWGCGREPQTARMQYTATSFAEPLQRVFGDVLRPDRDLGVSHLAESRYFTAAISYRNRIDDAVERGWYRPLIAVLTRWGELARRGQNGSVHRYLAYGLAALLVVLVASR